MIASLLLISVYIGFRFEWKFAVPILIALAHDLLITSGVYALTEREVTTSTVAALLTIMGYSLYDTIIVFDRIRENVPRMPRATFSQIANRSMSEVLTRSLATSFTVLMPVGALLLFGGETLKDFAFALLVGVASGAYSSIFIATPVLVEWKEREQVYMRRRRLVMEQHGGHVPAFATGALAAEPAVAGGRRAGRARGRASRAPGVPPAARGGRAGRRCAADRGRRRRQPRRRLPPPPPRGRRRRGRSAAAAEPSRRRRAPPAPPASSRRRPRRSRPPPSRPSRGRRPRRRRPRRRPRRRATARRDGDGDGAPQPESRTTSTAGSGSPKPKPKRQRPRKKHGRR